MHERVYSGVVQRDVCRALTVVAGCCLAARRWVGVRAVCKYFQFLAKEIPDFCVSIFSTIVPCVYVCVWVVGGRSVCFSGVVLP